MKFYLKGYELELRGSREGLALYSIVVGLVIHYTSATGINLAKSAAAVIAITLLVEAGVSFIQGPKAKGDQT